MFAVFEPGSAVVAEEVVAEIAVQDADADHCVVRVAAGQKVGAAEIVQIVETGAAVQRVIRRAAMDRVVAGFTIDRVVRAGDGVVVVVLAQVDRMRHVASLSFCSPELRANMVKLRFPVNRNRNRGGALCCISVMTTRKGRILFSIFSQ